MAAYQVRAVWDAEASVYWSESDIPGLNVEAERLGAFVDLVEAMAPGMLMENDRPLGRVEIICSSRAVTCLR